MGPNLRPAEIDLAIVGGGPAGLACAWKAAAQGLNTVLFEPKQGIVDKPCGEGIMPGALAILDRMGVAHSREHCQPFAGIRYQVQGTRPLEIDFPAPGRAYMRPVLDRQLKDRLRGYPNLQLISKRANVARHGEQLLLRAASGQSFLTNYLVVADGAGGGTAPWVRGKTRRHGRRLGLRARFHAQTSLERVEIHLGQGTDFYLTPLPGNLINVALLLEQEPASTQGASSMLEWALNRHPQVQAHLGELHTKASSTPLQISYPREICNHQVFLVGDAGGIADPILGTGLSVALRTGYQAAEAVADLFDGADAKQVVKRFRRQARAERIPRRRLASLLHYASTHERITRRVVSLLHRTPRLARHLAATAAGMPAKSDRAAS